VFASSLYTTGKEKKTRHQKRRKNLIGLAKARIKANPHFPGCCLRKTAVYYYPHCILSLRSLSAKLD
jgi:hypothetical protein